MQTDEKLTRISQNKALNTDSNENYIKLHR